jgi:predicted transcriptional regulator
MVASSEWPAGDAIRSERRGIMENWWSDLDEAIMDCLRERESMEPADIARRIGLSESAVCSLLGFLVAEGRVRVCRVAAAETSEKAAEPLAIAA